MWATATGKRLDCGSVQFSPTYIFSQTGPANTSVDAKLSHGACQENVGHYEHQQIRPFNFSLSLPSLNVEISLHLHSSILSSKTISDHTAQRGKSNAPFPNYHLLGFQIFLMGVRTIMNLLCPS
jgi:hypothetical protein